jgi:hypothetical protein
MLDKGRQERWVWIIAGIAVVLVAAFRIAVTSAPTAVSASAPAERSRPKQQATDRVPSPEVSAAETAQPPVSAVYECHANGQHIFSDRRCGLDNTVREVAAPNRMDAEDTTILAAPETLIAHDEDQAARAQVSADNVQPSECRRLEQEKDSIDARMREGYTSIEGEMFRDRLRVIAARYYDLRCRHFN